MGLTNKFALYHEPLITVTAGLGNAKYRQSSYYDRWDLLGRRAAGLVADYLENNVSDSRIASLQKAYAIYRKLRSIQNENGSWNNDSGEPVWFTPGMNALGAYVCYEAIMQRPSAERQTGGQFEHYLEVKKFAVHDGTGGDTKLGWCNGYMQQENAWGSSPGFHFANFVDSDDAGITYTGTWNTSVYTNALKDDYRYNTRVAGDKASFTFTGTGFVVWSAKDSNLGYMGIKIDGNYITDGNVDFNDGTNHTLGGIDLYSATKQIPYPVYRKTGLTYASHTVELIWVAGQKNPSSSSDYIILDAYEYTTNANTEDDPILGWGQCDQASPRYIINQNITLGITLAYIGHVDRENQIEWRKRAKGLCLYAASQQVDGYWYYDKWFDEPITTTVSRGYQIIAASAQALAASLLNNSDLYASARAAYQWAEANPGNTSPSVIDYDGWVWRISGDRTSLRETLAGGYGAFVLLNNDQLGSGKTAADYPLSLKAAYQNCLRWVDDADGDYIWEDKDSFQFKCDEFMGIVLLNCYLSNVHTILIPSGTDDFSYHDATNAWRKWLWGTRQDTSSLFSSSNIEQIANDPGSERLIKDTSYASKHYSPAGAGNDAKRWRNHDAGNVVLGVDFETGTTTYRWQVAIFQSPDQGGNYFLVGVNTDVQANKFIHLRNGGTWTSSGITVKASTKYRLEIDPNGTNPEKYRIGEYQNDGSISWSDWVISDANSVSDIKCYHLLSLSGANKAATTVYFDNFVCSTFSDTFVNYANWTDADAGAGESTLDSAHNQTFVSSGNFIERFDTGMEGGGTLKPSAAVSPTWNETLNGGTNNKSYGSSEDGSAPTSWESTWANVTPARYYFIKSELVAPAILGMTPVVKDVVLTFDQVVESLTDVVDDIRGVAFIVEDTATDVRTCATVLEDVGADARAVSQVLLDLVAEARVVAQTLQDTATDLRTIADTKQDTASDIRTKSQDTFDDESVDIRVAIQQLIDVATDLRSRAQILQDVASDLRTNSFSIADFAIDTRAIREQIIDVAGDIRAASLNETLQDETADIRAVAETLANLLADMRVVTEAVTDFAQDTRVSAQILEDVAGDIRTKSGANEVTQDTASDTRTVAEQTQDLADHIAVASLALTDVATHAETVNQTLAYLDVDVRLRKELLLDTDIDTRIVALTQDDLYTDGRSRAQLFSDIAGYIGARNLTSFLTLKGGLSGKMKRIEGRTGKMATVNTQKGRMTTR